MSASRLNSLSILLVACAVIYLLTQLWRIWKRLAALESRPTLGALATSTKPDADRGVLRSELKTSAFRTDRIRYIGGQRDGKYEWVETVEKEIEHPYAPPGYWCSDVGGLMVEVYKLIGVSPADPHVHLFEHVSNRSEATR